jgi:hypothetical protein
VGCDFSQAVIDRVSLDDILSFMHEHHAATTAGVAPSLLLSLAHFLIQAASSASARAGVMEDARLKLIRTAKDTKAAFIRFDLSLNINWVGLTANPAELTQVFATIETDPRALLWGVDQFE